MVQMVPHREVFRVVYKDNDSKNNAMAVFKEMGIMAENDDSSGNLERYVFVYEAAGSPNIEMVEKILKLFGDPVQKVPRTSLFKVQFKDNADKKALHEVKKLPGVVGVTMRKRNQNYSPNANTVLTVEVTGNIAAETVLKTLLKYGTARIC